MKRQIFVTPTAERRLKGIIRFSAHKWGEEIARNYALSIQSKIDAVASGELKTKINPDFSDRFSYCLAKRHYIFFELKEEKLIVVTLFHTAMSVKKRMEEESFLLREEVNL